MVYENDNFSIPEEIKKMSLEEIKREKERLYQELKSNKKIEKNKTRKRDSILLSLFFS